jgi:hypothetical protein
LKRKSETSRKTLGQVIVCLGCCCGRTDKGHPAVPVDWLKAEWRARQLPKKIHLTISGCVGPCDASNVVTLLFGDAAVWLGGLSSFEHYEAIANWAEACAAQDALVPLPASLEEFRMTRFLASPVSIGG